MISLKKKVVIAMSGGVDSSVAAVLLKEKGYEVIGVSLKVWDDQENKKSGKTCCSFQDIEDARTVCRQMNIPFYAFNYEKIFQEFVISNFVSEYLKGQTPNPCIACNRHIKFGHLFDEAKNLGADFIATGHHARVRQDKKEVYHLLKGVDLDKDQSYVLYDLTQEKLANVLLPIGDYTKDQVRLLAKEFQISTFNKKESQDICFIPDRDHAAFIQKYCPSLTPKKGSFVDKSGRVLGEHQGIHHYTIGQRRGLGKGFDERKYVTRIDPKTNEVQLGSKDELLSEGLVACDVNWIQSLGSSPIQCGVKIRYQKKEIPSVIEAVSQNGPLVIRFKEKHSSVAPGQAAVFYKGDEMIGGGKIERAI